MKNIHMLICSEAHRKHKLTLSKKVLVGENVQRLEGEDVLPIIPPRVPGNLYLNTNISILVTS